jgi:hypothetical protein
MDMAKQISRILCILVFAAALTPAAQAQFNNTGFYLEVGMGKSTFKDVTTADLDETARGFFDDFELPVQSLSSTLKTKDRSISLITGYRMNPYLTFEGGFFRLGAFQYASTGTVDDAGTIRPARFDFTFRAKGFLVGATGTLPIGKSLELRARAGFASTDGRVRFAADVEGEGLDDHYTENSQDIYYGAGVGLKVWTFYRVGLDLMHHGNVGKTSADVDNILLSFGYVY